MTSEECEAAFRDIVRTLPSVDDPHRVEELSLLALALLLRRAESAPFKAELSQRVHAALANAHTPDQVHAAARECIHAIEEAWARRQPRTAPAEHQAAHHPHAHHPHAHHPPGHHKPAHHGAPAHGDEGERSGRLWLNAGLAVLLAALGGAVWWGASRTETGPNVSDSASFVEQMVAAAKGDVPPRHMFGGSLALSSMNGAPMVVAENVPPKICAAAGMRLVRLGVVSVNGITPSRVSSAVLTELCNKEQGNATIMWVPSEP